MARMRPSLFDHPFDLTFHPMLGALHPSPQAGPRRERDPRPQRPWLALAALLANCPPPPPPAPPPPPPYMATADLTAYWCPILLAQDPRPLPFSRPRERPLTQAFSPFFPLAAGDLTWSSPPAEARLAGVDREKGKFRAFLLASCRHFLGHRRDHDRAVKRGGGKLPLSIDARDAEGRYLREPAHHLTPEAFFVRRWAYTLLEGVLDDLRSEYTGRG